MTKESYEPIESRIRLYVARLRRALGGLEAAEIDDIVEEIRGHIGERLDASSDPDKTADEVLAALGNPEELAAKYQTEAVLARGRTSYSPVTLLQATQRWAMEGLVGIFVFLLALVGYGLAVGLVLVAVAKPFLPGQVGLWWDPPEHMVLGVVNASVSPEHELVGWWIIPLGLVAGGLLWLGMSRLLRWMLRSFRASSSPLGTAARRTPG